MLFVLRLLAILTGGFTAWRVLDGSMTASIFKVPDLVLGVVLVVAALLPRAQAPTALLAASAYSLGVFSVALAQYMVPGRPVDPLLLAGMAVNLATIFLLMPRPGSH
ncbi:hypothetical protein ACFQ1E_10675 [Sphingomonas canadensis]|uniref:Uncharacterized protein n=1 Tax=Sphingomonas canadensis TaxID=1219257 RepID=A0ABW3H7R2_9SPHN|nr:hypothetical protein [Sphingomonas canadensis]MCW3836417.1 hypothetical protein [Sphingomonas canadensis]